MICTKGRRESRTHQGTEKTYLRNLYETRADGSEDYEDNTHKEQSQEEDIIALEEVHEALAKMEYRKSSFVQPHYR
ncbi:hypothetical protein Trydic_g23476 [Trypoxylus dichotomus]